MAMESICSEVSLSAPKEDYRNSTRIEQYRFGQQAIYFAGWPTTKYLPFSAIRQAWTQDSLLPVTGTCGKALPVTILRIRYKGKYYQTFTFEKQTNARKALEILQAACPDAVFAPEPVGPQRTEFLAALSAE